MILGVLMFSGLAIFVVGVQIWLITTPIRHRDIGEFAYFEYQSISLTTQDDVEISGWYVPGTRPEAIVLVHGIHANRAFLRPQALMFADRGYHLVMLDLRGHGQSGDATMTYGYREAFDVQAAVDYLDNLPEVEHIAVLGHSLGGAAVVRAAADDDRIEAIVVQSSYSSLPQAVEDAYNNYSVFPKWTAPLIVGLAELRTQVDISQVSSVRDLAEMSPRPVFIIQGEGDPQFGPHHGQVMFEAATGPKEFWVFSGTGHLNPINPHPWEYEQRVLAFFEQAFGDQEN